MTLMTSVDFNFKHSVVKFEMNCAKVLFKYLEKNCRFKSPTYFGNYLKVAAFSHRNIKVKPYSTKANMEDLYHVPECINGMKKLDKNVFNKTVIVPCLVVSSLITAKLSKFLKKYFLKIFHLKPVKDTENGQIQILIDPKKINSWNDFDENIRQSLISENITEDNLSKIPIDITYDNWTAEALLKAVLPKDEPPLTSYSVVGHIIHLNIKDHLLDYRHVIGEILLDKIPFAKTIIYKTHFIDNVYRSFQLEVICGESNFITTVKENGCQFKFDFSKVYWNPRLSTEHQKIVEILKEKDVLFDVFAGVGPFAIPAAKKKCLVFANDLNPESVKWLEHNITLNKRAKGNIKTYNKDGKDFILEDFKENIIKIWQDEFYGCIHIVMNLPMVAPTFIKYFNKLISNRDLLYLDVEKIKKCLPIMHCYFFSKEEEEDKETVFEELSGIKLNDIKHNFHFVRQVSRMTGMFRITFSLPFEYLVEDYHSDNDKVEPLPKRICLE